MHASSELGTLQESWPKVGGKPRVSKKAGIQIVEATEWQTCVCYAVVLRVDPSTSTVRKTTLTWIRPAILTQTLRGREAVSLRWPEYMQGHKGAVGFGS